MKKIAVFVEGQTELVFVRKLFEELAGKNQILFDEKELNGGKFISISGKKAVSNEKYYVMIVDCHGDNSVRSAMEDQRPGLIRENYDILLGLRDLFPIKSEELARLERGLHHGLPTAQLPTYICVAVREVEAWFAQEEFHYPAIDPLLTKSTIKSLGFDLDVDCAEKIDHPSDFLDTAYMTVGKRYQKSLKQVNRTANAIDYANLFYNLQTLLPSFSKFARHIDEFLA